MKQYLLSIFQPDGPPPQPETLDAIMRDVGQVDSDLRTAGAWVFAAGLFPPSTATVLRPDGEQVLVTDGPYAEAKEHLGGLTVIQTDNLDDALQWGRRLAAATTLPVEVRPMQGGPAA